MSISSSGRKTLSLALRPLDPRHVDGRAVGRRVAQDAGAEVGHRVPVLLHLPARPHEVHDGVVREAHPRAQAAEVAGYFYLELPECNASRLRRLYQKLGNR